MELTLIGKQQPEFPPVTLAKETILTQLGKLGYNEERTWLKFLVNDPEHNQPREFAQAILQRVRTHMKRKGTTIEYVIQPNGNASQLYLFVRRT